MAFSNSLWGALSSSGKLKLFSYDASGGDDATATDFFAPKWQELAVNDVIYVETASSLLIKKVTAVGPNTITIADA